MEALARAEYIPAGMELFGGQNARSWAVIQKTLENSDYYVLIVGNRYGSKEAVSGLSYTEMEYDCARRLDIPVVALLHKNRGSLEAQFVDDDRALDKFINKVKIDCQVDFWLKKEDLPKLALQGIIKTIRDFPRTGWSRSNSEVEGPLIAQLMPSLRNRVHGSTYRENVEARVVYRLDDAEKMIAVTDRVSYLLRGPDPQQLQLLWQFAPEELKGVNSLKITAQGYAENGAKLSKPVVIFELKNVNGFRAIAPSVLKKIATISGYRDYRIELQSEYLIEEGAFISWEMPLLTHGYALHLLFPKEDLRVKNFKVYDPIGGDAPQPDRTETYFALKLFGWILPDSGLAWQLERTNNSKNRQTP